MEFFKCKCGSVGNWGSKGVCAVCLKKVLPTKESEVQKQIMDYLRLKRCLVFKHRSVGIWKQDTQRYIPLAYGEKGISDIIGLTENGQFLAIEVKKRGQTRSKDGKPSQEQLDFLERVREKKGIGILAYSIDDVIEAI